MIILYLGDIVGLPGRLVIKNFLQKFRIDNDVDLVIAQSENITHGKGLSLAHFNDLRKYGVDVFTGGNHSFERKDTIRLIQDTSRPVTAPGNYKKDNYPHYKIIKQNGKKIFVASILGTIYPKQKNELFSNPFIFADKIREYLQTIKPDLSIVNYHGDLSSEKVSIGHYLDGIVDIVVGDHWHVPSADLRTLPKGTVHITDVGMVGTLNSSLGASFDEVFDRLKGNNIKMKIEESAPYQVNGIIVNTNSKSKTTTNQVRIIINNL